MQMCTCKFKTHAHVYITVDKPSLLPVRKKTVGGEAKKSPFHKTNLCLCVHANTHKDTDMHGHTQITDTKTDVCRHTPTCFTHIRMNTQTCIQTQMWADKREHTRTSGGVYLQQNMQLNFQLMETLVKDWKAHSFVLQMCTTAHVQTEGSITGVRGRKWGGFMIMSKKTKSPVIIKHYPKRNLLYTKHTKHYFYLLSLNQDIHV